MKRSAQIILHMGILISILMLETILLYIGCSIQGGESFYIHIFPWAFQICILYLINEWLSGRELSVNAFLFINLFFCAASVYTGILWIQAVPATMTVRIFQVVFSVSPVLFGAYLTWEPERPQTLVIFLDALIAFFLIYLFLDLVGILLPFAGFETAFLFMTAIVLLSMVLVRTSSEHGEQFLAIGGILPVAALIAACLLTAAVFSLLISGQVKGLTDALVLVLTKLLMSIIYVFGLLFDLVGAFFGWIMNLLPDAEAEAVPMENLISIPEITAAEEEAAISIPPALLFGTFGVVGLILLSLLFWHLKGKKIQKKKKHTNPGKIERTSRFSVSLRNAFARLKDRIRLHICLIQKRRTPSALAIHLERYGRKHAVPRMTGESVPSYLKRLAGHPALSDKPDFSKALTDLSDLICQEYYSDTPVTLSPELYRKIRSGLSS